jgi:hypothetical protein
VLVVIGLLPIPGLFDEALLAIIAPLLVFLGPRCARPGDAPARARRPPTDS